MDILLTNDDGPDSPLFGIAVERLDECGNLEVVVPATEKSWMGKAMTRYGDLRTAKLSIRGKQVHSFEGTPADCSNFGIFNVFEEKPDLVVSGINVGSNVGLGFVFSSGTVGAGLEANMSGVPAIAFSQVLDRSFYNRWVADREAPSDELERLHKQCQMVIHRVFDILKEDECFLSECVTWNVNMPYQVSDDWEVTRTYVGHTYYGSCFKPVGDAYQHNIDSPKVDDRDLSDSHIVDRGHVSLSRLDVRTFGQL